MKYPLGKNEVVFDPNETKQSYIEQGFVEVEVGVAPEYSYSLQDNVQAKRKQYGLRHYVSSTIHEAMGDTLPSVAIEISMRNKDFKIWDKGQMIVVISRTKRGKDTIFVGNKQDILAALKNLLTRKPNGQT